MDWKGCERKQQRSHLTYCPRICLGNCGKQQNISIWRVRVLTCIRTGNYPNTSQALPLEPTFLMRFISNVWYFFGNKGSEIQKCNFYAITYTPFIYILVHLISFVCITNMWYIRQSQLSIFNNWCLLKCYYATCFGHSHHNQALHKQQYVDVR
jgi:hypothetical protein